MATKKSTRVTSRKQMLFLNVYFFFFLSLLFHFDALVCLRTASNSNVTQRGRRCNASDRVTIQSTASATCILKLPPSDNTVRAHFYPSSAAVRFRTYLAALCRPSESDRITHTHSSPPLNTFYHELHSRINVSSTAGRRT